MVDEEANERANEKEIDRMSLVALELTKTVVAYTGDETDVLSGYLVENKEDGDLTIRNPWNETTTIAVITGF